MQICSSPKPEGTVRSLPIIFPIRVDLPPSLSPAKFNKTAEIVIIFTLKKTIWFVVFSPRTSTFFSVSRLEVLARTSLRIADLEEKSVTWKKWKQNQIGRKRKKEKEKRRPTNDFRCLSFPSIARHTKKNWTRSQQPSRDPSSFTHKNAKKA